MAKKMRGLDSRYKTMVSDGRKIADAFASQQKPTGSLKQIYDYYFRSDIQVAVYEFAKGRQITVLKEFHPMFDGLRAPEDVLYIALHCAKIDRHLWPSLHGTISRVDESGNYFCDFVVAIDYKKDWRMCFDEMQPLVEQLRDFGLSFCIKYSGNCSPHLIIPGELFPPDATRSQKIRTDLLAYIKNTLKHPELLDTNLLREDYFLRLAYSLNENTGLVSVPILPEEYTSFSRRLALPDNAEVIPTWWGNYPEDAQYRLEAFFNQVLHSKKFEVKLQPIRTIIPAHYANKNLLFVTLNHDVSRQKSEQIVSIIRFCRKKISAQRGRYAELCRRLTLHRQKVHNAIYDFLEELPNQESRGMLLKRYKHDLDNLANVLVNALPNQLSEHQKKVEGQLAKINSGIASIPQADFSTVKAKVRNLVSVSRRIQKLKAEFTALAELARDINDGNATEEPPAQLQIAIDRFVREYNDCRVACGLESSQAFPKNLGQHLENWSKETKKEAQQYLDSLDLLKEQAKVNQNLQLLMLLNAQLATMEERLKEMAKIMEELSELRVPEQFKIELAEQIRRTTEFDVYEAQFYTGVLLCLSARDNLIITVDGCFLLLSNKRDRGGGLLIDVLHAAVADDRLSGVILLKDALMSEGEGYHSLFYPEINNVRLPVSFNLKQKITRVILDVNQGRLCRPNVMMNILLEELGDDSFPLISRWLDLMEYEQVWRQYGEVDIRCVNAYQPGENAKKGEKKTTAPPALATVIDFEEILRE